MAGNNYNNTQYYSGNPNENPYNQPYNQEYSSPPPYMPPSYYPNQNQDNNQNSHGHHRPPPPGPYGYAPPTADLPARHPRILFLISITRPWAVVVPLVTLVMNIWWFSTGRICGGVDDVTSDCFMVLWLSMPIAIVSLIWSLATTISSRRAAHLRPSIPSKIQFPIQTLIAGGATACIAILGMRLAKVDWPHSVGGIVALLAMITLVNWLLAGFAAYEWNLDRKRRQQSDSFVL